MKKILRHTLLVAVLNTIVLSGMAGVYVHENANSTLDSLNVKVENVTLGQEDKSRTSRSFFPSWFTQPFRSAPQVSTEKLLSNVKVFPNPTAESINLSFQIGKRSDVSIKVMDALGNELMTLLSQPLDEGSQNHSFDIQGRLKSGLYFVRLSVGSETVVKRVSVL